MAGEQNIDQEKYLASRIANKQNRDKHTQSIEKAKGSREIDQRAHRDQQRIKENSEMKT